MAAHRFMANIGARITEFMARMRQVQNTIRTTANDVRVDVGADVSAFNRRMAMIRARIDSLIRERVVIRIEARIAEFQNKINRIATNIRAFGELAQHTFSGLKTSLLPAIVPLLSNVAVAIGNLGPMLGTLAGSTFALVGAFASAGAGAVAFGAVAIPTIKKLFDESTKLTAQQAAAKASFDAFKSTYDGLVKATEQPILKAFQSAMTAANAVLSKLQPMFISSSNAVANLMAQLNQSLGTPPVQAFLEHLNTTAAPMLTTIMQAFGNTFKGLGSMFVAFAPLSASTAQGFLEMTHRFAEWSNGLSASSKFQAFTNYVNENMPKIRAIFRDAFAGIIYMFSAFSGSSAGMMDSLVQMMARFKEWSATLSQNQGFQTFMGYVQQTTPSVLSLISNLTSFIINLGIGMAPLGAAILVLVNKFLAFTNSMMESNRIIGVLLASFISFGGILLAIVPNIIAFGTLFKGVGTAVMGLATKFIAFIPKISTLGTTITALAAKALPALGAAFGFITSPVGLVIAAIAGLTAIFVGLYKTNDTFRNQVQMVWSAIQTAISTVVNAIKTLVTNVWGQVTSFWKSNQDNIKASASTVWNAIGKVVTTTMNVIGSIMKAIWPVVKALIVSTWTAIQNVIQGAVKVVLGIIQTFSSLFQGDWRGVWDGVKKILSGALQAVWGAANLYFVGKLLTPLKSFGTLAGSALTGAWSAIKTIFNNALMSVKTFVTQGFSALVQVVAFNMHLAKQAIVSGWNAAKAFLSSVNLVTIGKNIIQGLINGIGSMMGAVQEKVKSIASSISEGMKKLLGIHSPSRVMAGIAKWIPVGVAKGIQGNLGLVQAATRRMAKAAAPDFSKTIKTTQKTLDEVGRIMEKASKAMNAKVLKIQKDYEQKRAELERKSSQQIATINANAAASKKGMTKKQEQQIANILADGKAQREKLAKQEAEAIAKIHSKSQSEILGSMEQYVQNKESLEQWSTENQAEYWKHATSLFKENTDERIKAQNHYKKAMDTLLAEQFENEKTFIDMSEKYGGMSLTRKIQAYEQYMKGYKKGSEQQIYYEEQIAETKKEIHEKLISLNDEYTAKVAEAKQKELEGIKELNQAYEDAVTSRASSIYSFKSLFDEVDKYSRVSSRQLIRNLEDQVSVLDKWAQNIQSLSRKGIEDGLLAELQAMGPSAYAEIAALNRMTDTELSEFNSLWKTKTALARTQAETELIGLKDDTAKKIEELKAATSTQLTEYKSEWMKQIKTIRTGTVNEFNAMTASMKAIGINAINGLRDGMKSQIPTMLKEVQGMVKDIEKTIQKTLTLQSPTRTSIQGLSDSIAGTRAAVQNSARQLAEAATTNLKSLTGDVKGRISLDRSWSDTSHELTGAPELNELVRTSKRTNQLLEQLDFTVNLDGEKISDYVDERTAAKYDIMRSMRGV